MNKPIVLITGSNGLLGRQLCNMLEKQNFEIIATSLGLDRLSKRKHQYVELDITSNIIDILDKNFRESKLNEN